MAEVDKDVLDYVHSIENNRRREDAITLLSIMQRVTGLPAKLWGTMVGFGSYDYTYDSGHSGTSFLVGFAPRKQNTVIYIMPGCKNYAALLDGLGKHRSSVSCIYINKLADVDLSVLETLIAQSFQDMAAKYHNG